MGLEFLIHIDDQILKKSQSILYIKQHPPLENTFKLNIDGSALENPGFGGARGVIQHHRGNWIIGFQQENPANYKDFGRVYSSKNRAKDSIQLE